MGDHGASAYSSVCIEDQVFYARLVPDESYAIKGILMNKATAAPGSPKTGLAQTGDANRVAPLVCLAVMAALAATSALLHGKRRSRAEGTAESEEAEEDSEEEDGKDE